MNTKQVTISFEFEDDGSFDQELFTEAVLTTLKSNPCVTQYDVHVVDTGCEACQDLPGQLTWDFK